MPDIFIVLIAVVGFFALAALGVAIHVIKTITESRAEVTVHYLTDAAANLLNMVVLAYGHAHQERERQVYLIPVYPCRQATLTFTIDGTYTIVVSLVNAELSIFRGTHTDSKAEARFFVAPFGLIGNVQDDPYLKMIAFFRHDLAAAETA